MAYEGELVKMANGKWARFQQLRISNAGHQDSDEVTILVAVELDEANQDLLAEAEASLTSFRREEDAYAEGPVPTAEEQAAVH